MLDRTEHCLIFGITEDCIAHNTSNYIQNNPVQQYLSAVSFCRQLNSVERDAQIAQEAEIRRYCRLHLAPYIEMKKSFLRRRCFLEYNYVMKRKYKGGGRKKGEKKGKSGKRKCLRKLFLTVKLSSTTYPHPRTYT